MGSNLFSRATSVRQSSTCFLIIITLQSQQATCSRSGSLLFPACFINDRSFGLKCPLMSCLVIRGVVPHRITPHRTNTFFSPHTLVLFSRRFHAVHYIYRFINSCLLFNTKYGTQTILRETKFLQ